jgi:hypothetical protein
MKPKVRGVRGRMTDVYTTTWGEDIDRAANKHKQEKKGMSLKVKVATYEVVEPGTYSAEIAEIAETETRYGRGVKVRFRLVDAEYGGVVVSAIASIPELGIGPKSKLYRWLRALGTDPADMDEVDLVTMVGRRCRVQIINEERDCQVYNRIADVLPSARPQRQREPEPAPEPEDDAPFDEEGNLRY